MELIIILVAPLFASLLSFFAAKSIKTLGFIAVVSTSFELLGTASIAAILGNNASFALTQYLRVDHVGAILLFLLSFGGLMASIYARGYLTTEMAKGEIGFNRTKKMYAQMHLFLLAMSLAITTTNPIVTWIAVEATTLTTAFLISFYNKPSAIEAAWKYLILNSVGLLFAFFGTLLFLTPQLHTANAGLATWQSLLIDAPTFTPFIVKMAFLFIFIGYGTKVGLVPMHLWLPDAHSSAPSPISSLLSGVLLNVPLLAILRFKTITDASIGPDFSSRLFIIFGILSLVVSSTSILIQKNYKRLLAFSSIEHMGIITLGFGIGGVASYAALLHMIYHSLTKSLLFLSAGNIFLKFRSMKIENIRGLITNLPITAIIFFIGILTIIGMPPMGMFYTEFTILTLGAQQYLGVTITALVALSVVGIGFIRHLAYMIFGESNDNILPGEHTAWTIVPIVILVAVIVSMSFVVPNAMQSFIHLAVGNL